MQPLSSNPFTSDEFIERPISSIAPMATELDELHPPITSRLSYIDEEFPDGTNENEASSVSGCSDQGRAISVTGREITRENVLVNRRQIETTQTTGNNCAFAKTYFMCLDLLKLFHLTKIRYQNTKEII